MLLTEYRRTPPNSIHYREDSNPDYETLSPYEAENREDDDGGHSALGTLRRPMLSYIKEQSNDSSSDYESISSLDLGGYIRRNDGIPTFTKTISTSSHDYESIDNLAITTSIDIDSPDSPPYIPDGATRNKLLKIDSEGYASVLYPHEEDESWEFDCLNQDRHEDSQPTTNSNITVNNVEEAWKHQLEKGYASLTMQQEPPPLFSRTRSAPHAAQAVHRPEPQDYEVPMHLMLPPPPPPMIALRRISLLKQQAASAASADLSNVREEESSKGAGKDTVDGAANTESMDTSAQAQSDQSQSEIFKMRSRVMTAPTLSYQTFTVTK